MSNETQHTHADVRELAGEIIRSLDLIARNYDSYEYGLPVMTHYDEMVDAVVAILRTPRGGRSALWWAANELVAALEGRSTLTVQQCITGVKRLLAEADLRTPRGEGETMDADAMWYHWSSGHEDAALQGLRTATDDEGHRFLSMLADWQRCPKPSDHDTIAALRSEAQGEDGEVVLCWTCRAMNWSDRAGY